MEFTPLTNEKKKVISILGAGGYSQAQLQALSITFYNSHNNLQATRICCVNSGVQVGEADFSAKGQIVHM